MAGAVRVAVLPGELNTTLAPTGLGEGQARDVLNCDTGRGLWELDKRHRRFLSAPTSTESTSCTPYAAGTASSVARAGSVGAWTSVASVGASDDVYASSAALGPGEKTETLRVILLVPAGSIDAAGTLTIRVERQADPDGNGVALAISDMVQPTLSGVPLGANLAEGEGLPDLDITKEYSVDLAALGVTPGQIMAGDVGVDLGWRSSVTDPDAFDPANWSFNLAPSSTSIQPDEYPGSYGGTTTYHLVATWRGAGAAPPFVPVSVVATSTAGGPYNVPGTVRLDNGQGTVVTGTIPSPPSGPVLSAVSTVVHYLPVVGSVARKTFVTTRSNSGASPTAVDFSQGGIVPTVVAPFDVTVKVDMVRASFCAAGASEVGGSPDGILYANYNGEEELAVVHGEHAFTAPGSPEHAMTSPWSDDLAPTPLAAGPWVLWAFDGKVFYTSPAGGVWYRTIGAETDLQPLYRDTQSPGSSGVATYQADAAWIDLARFDDPADTLAFTQNGGGAMGAGTGYATGDYAGKIQIETTKTWAQVVVTLSAVKDVKGADSMGIVLEDKGPTTDGYSSKAADNYVVLENSTGTATASLPIVVSGKVDVKGGTYFGWVDLSGVSDAIKSDIKKITMRVGTKPGIGSTRFRFEHVYFGGIRYKDSAWGKAATTAGTASVEYAYNVTEGGTIGQASGLTVVSSTHLGTRLNTGAPYMGASIVVNVPRGDAPFTGAATINLYRKIGSAYQKIATGPNTDSLVFTDRFQDATIAANPGTYPVTALNFDAPTGSFSGQVSGIVCGCAWKGSNVYAGDDGKIYGSRSGIYDEVLWDGVVLTNDNGSADLGPPRTLILADDLKSPALCLVPGESLYALTATEVYVFIPGETFYTSSFPRVVDGARGVLGVRAACRYGDACLYGAQDGLWLVRKATADSNQPDSLIEVTKDNRGAWQWLLGASPSTLVVRQHLGETWVFNGTRYLHLTRQQRTIKGEWADGRSVVDATSDPAKGLILQLSDGSVALVGPYVTDGGTDLAGTNGTPPTWNYRTGIRMLAHAAIRAVVYAEIGAAGAAAVDIETERLGSPVRVTVAGDGTRVVSLPFDREASAGSLLSFTIAGDALSRVLSVGIELVDKEASRQLDVTVNS